MSLDRSLKAANALIRHRNVLTRAERLEKLKEQEKWNDSKSVYGLPKVAHRKMETAKGAAKADAGEAGAAVGTAPAAAPAAGAKGAAAAKGGAPAKGAAPAKGSAPAKGAAPAAAKGAAPSAGAKKK